MRIDVKLSSSSQDKLDNCGSEPCQSIQVNTVFQPDLTRVAICVPGEHKYQPEGFINRFHSLTQMCIKHIRQLQHHSDARKASEMRYQCMFRLAEYSRTEKSYWSWSKWGRESLSRPFRTWPDLGPTLSRSWTSWFGSPHQWDVVHPRHIQPWHDIV